MKRIISFLCLCVCFMLMNGCLTAERYSFTFDYETGRVVMMYHDIGSQKGGECDYSAKKDWEDLKELILDTKPEYDPDVVEETTKELFEEKGVLSGRKILRVTCPKCFPSKAAILSLFHPDEEKWRFEIINDEIFLFLSYGNEIVSTNAKIVKTKSNQILVWPKAAKKIEFAVVETGIFKGTSLLPYYQKEKDALKRDQDK
ncbi:MAG: hypothetical protein MUO24_03855 [Desulfobacterales bacterium]|nr:hypothetical protein [Desulfobacterales bacterium]